LAMGPSRTYFSRAGRSFFGIMYSLSLLTEKLSPPDHIQMVAQGYAVWLTWSKDLPGSVPETLQSFGGFDVAVSGQQSLWLFVSQDFMGACAQLYKWYASSELMAHVRVFPVKLNFGPDMRFNLSVEERIQNLAVEYPRDFEIWVHARVKDGISPIPGIKLEQPAATFLPEEMYWCYFRATQQVRFTPKLSWIFIIRPEFSGDPLQGARDWEKQQEVLQELGSRMGFKTHRGGKDLLLVEVEGIRQLKNWCLELLVVFSGMKAGRHLSCYLIGVENPGINPADGIPERLLPEWKQVEPDQLYLPLKNILQLGRSLQVLPDSMPPRDRKITDLCRAALGPSYQEEIQARLDVSMPQGLVQGKSGPCFYCGLKIHAEVDCPTRQLFHIEYVLEQMALLDLQDINSGLESLEQEIRSSTPWQTLLQGSSPSRLVMRTILGINYPAQHRTLRLMRRSRGRDWPQGLKQLSDAEDDHNWGIIENLRMKQTGLARNSLKKLCLSQARDFRPRTMFGFLSLEENDHKAARAYWEEAGRLGYTPLQQSYHLYLRARLAEISNDFSRAYTLYQEAQKTSPGMQEARYRQGVCLVKAGDVEQALSIFLEICNERPEIFNQILVDPELAYGHQHLMSSLYSTWQQRKKKAQTSGTTLQKLARKAQAWFPEEHPRHDQFQSRIQGLQKLAGRDNYVAFVRLVDGVGSLQKDLEIAISNEVHEVKKDFAHIAQRLREINAEAGLIPLNSIAAAKIFRLGSEVRAMLKEVQSLDINAPEGYRLARAELTMAAEHISRMQKRLKSLELFRDASLFLYFMTRSFFWILLAVLLAGTFLVGAGTYAGLRREVDWAFSVLEQREAMLQVGIMLMAILSLALAAIRTTISFERLKAKYYKNKKE